MTGQRDVVPNRLINVLRHSRKLKDPQGSDAMRLSGSQHHNGIIPYHSMVALYQY